MGAGVEYARRRIRSAYREGGLSDAQVRRLLDAGFEFEPRRSRPVLDLTTGVTYGSAAEAAESVGSNKSTLAKAISARRPYKGHAFCYADDPEPPAEEFTSPRREVRPVLDLTTGSAYGSRAEAAESVGGKGSSLAKAISARRLYKGRAFCYAADPNPPAVSEYREPRMGRERGSVSDAGPPSGQ